MIKLAASVGDSFDQMPSNASAVGSGDGDGNGDGNGNDDGNRYQEERIDPILDQDDTEATPLLHDEVVAASSSPKDKGAPFHVLTLKIVIILDFILGLSMYFVYILTFQPSPNQPNPSLFDSLVPLDIFLLCLSRFGLLYRFVSTKNNSNNVQRARDELEHLNPSSPTSSQTTRSGGNSFLKHVPIWTSFISLFYLLIRTMFATTLLAYITLTIAFTFTWTELAIYIYFIIKIGPDCWISNSTVDGGMMQDGIGIEAQEVDLLDFQFPESPSYDNNYSNYRRDVPNSQSPSPFTIPNQGGAGVDEDDDFVSSMMGTSTPISIVIPKRHSFQHPSSSERNHDQRQSKSFVPHYNQQRGGRNPSNPTTATSVAAAFLDSPLSNVCKLYLARLGELSRFSKMLFSQPVATSPSSPSTDSLVSQIKKENRHMSLARFSIFLYEVEAGVVLPESGGDVESSLYTLLASLDSCKSLCSSILQVEDFDHLIDIFSGQSRYQDQWRSAAKVHATPERKGGKEGQQQEHERFLPSQAMLTMTSSPLQLMEERWWRLWRLELKCIQCKTLLYQALLYFMNGRYVKGAMSLSKCHAVFCEIGGQVRSENSLGESVGGSGASATTAGRPMESAAGLPGSFGEVVYMLKAGIMESQTLVSSVFCLLPSLAPNLQESYLKALSLPNDKWLGIRNLYQLTLKNSLESFPASLFLLYSLSTPSSSLFHLAYPAEGREIATMLSVLENGVAKNIPLLQFGVAAVYQRHGMRGEAENRLHSIYPLILPSPSLSSMPASSNSSTPTPNSPQQTQTGPTPSRSLLSAVELGVRMDLGVLRVLSLDWQTATIHLDAVWLLLLERRRGRCTCLFDLEAGLLHLGLKRYISVLTRSAGGQGTSSAAALLEETGNAASLKAAHFLYYTVVPSLTENLASRRARQTRYAKTITQLTRMCVEDGDIPVFLLFVCLYFRGDIGSLAGSNSNAPILVNLAIQIDCDFRNQARQSASLTLFSVLVHSLVVGTAVKYLHLHNNEHLKYFSELYPDCSSLAEVARKIYQDGLRREMEEVSPLILSLGLPEYIKFELAELEALCFENYEISLDFLNQCVAETSLMAVIPSTTSPSTTSAATGPGQPPPSAAPFAGGSKSPASTIPTPYPHSLPSFLRKSNRKMMRNSMSVGSPPDGPMSMSTSISHTTEWGADSLKMGVSFTVESSLFGYLDFEFKARNAIRVILQKLGHP